MVRQAVLTALTETVMLGFGPQRSAARSWQAIGVAQDPRIAKLPAPLQDHGRRILTEADDEKRADLAEALAETDALGALDFLLTLLDTDPSADVREQIVGELEDVDDLRVTPALERRALTDQDIDIAAIALDLLRARATRLLLGLLERRLASERRRRPRNVQRPNR
jgi:HEAT repeat protein